jgi:DNA invertase Pin-like site-specific DNA recombinase
LKRWKRFDKLTESSSRYLSHGLIRPRTPENDHDQIMTIFAGIAEFERGLIRERTNAGREAARKRGVRFGRPRKLTAEQENLARRLVSEGKAVRELAAAFKVHAATIAASSSQVLGGAL